MKQIEYILNNETEVLDFLRSKYPLYHQSNIFFRDIQYGIQTMLFRKRMSVGYADAEKIAKEFVAELEKKKVLNPVDQQSWVLNYPQFKKPASAPPPSAKPAAKPAGAAPSAPRPAVPSPAGAKPSLPPLSRPGASSPKPGGLPPISRPAPGGAAAKPGGLPPLSRPTAKPAAPAQSQTDAPKQEAAKEIPAATGSTQQQPAPAPVQMSTPVAPGVKKPLPPIGGRTPAGPKK